MNNILLLTDSYKLGHYNMYPKDTKVIYSYFESRGGIYNNVKFFGLQYILQFLEGNVVTQEKIDEAESYSIPHVGGFNREGWQYILDNYNGKLPVNIFAVPEGALVPTNVPLIVVYNTDEKCAWLTNYLETLLSQVWYPSTVCTQSYYLKEVIKKHLIKTVGNTDGIDFMLHDFGMRSGTSMESAAIGGAAHLVNFQGTDTVNSLRLCRDVYGCDMAGFSINASEHSIMTINGREGEEEVVNRLLKEYNDSPISLVADSYNIYRFCDTILPKFKDRIEKRKVPLIVRPDSLDPTEILPDVTESLMKVFGYKNNKMGYRELPPYLKVIQGDGMDRHSLPKVLQSCTERRLASNNFAFGCGSGLVQKLNRDDLKFAFKCSAKKSDKWYDVYKDPYSPKGTSMKKSKRGLVWTYVDDGKYYYDNKQNFVGKHPSGLKLVFECGNVNRTTFEEIRTR